MNFLLQKNEACQQLQSQMDASRKENEVKLNLSFLTNMSYLIVPGRIFIPISCSCIIENNCTSTLAKQIYYIELILKVSIAYNI